jgi:polyisoprenoid-binding protein YceI
MNNLVKLCIFTFALGSAMSVQSATYKVDVKGAHAFVQFKIKHLGYSWLLGEFNSFDGEFNWDAKDPEASSIRMDIDTTSLDSNHAERDKHLKGKDFLDVKKFPAASFTSTAFVKTDDADSYNLTGDLTLKGVTRSITFEVEKIGEGRDPWGGYRVGFEGEVKLKLSDYDIDYNLGPASEWVNMGLYIEGIKQ